ncbi:VWA domain-containing protein [Streptomyces sp. SKN60]|uniref:vWA domain-containing protein n=1 Tax=Streptomyces sp. SKN60 TaxID=2855506 RepID=UPI002246A487|nr:vWA domain-containing protein [Streptomyces sp. SKN60]MCX2185349.1 VWA domain-containing protein [Streptomyces sp. SKN60]
MKVTVQSKPWRTPPQNHRPSARPSTRRDIGRAVGRSLRTGGTLLAAALLVVAGPLAGPAGALPARAAAADPAEGADPIDFVVLVDQSESLADQDLARETEAAALIGQGEISERSRAAVIGFGSSEKAGQSPVNEVCPLAVVDAAGRQRLSDCVKQLNRRDRARLGPGTDFPAAVRQAVTRLTENGGTAGDGGPAKNPGAPAAPKTPKVVFLLTDGRLDVSDSPEYGTDAPSRQSNGEKRLAEELARARAAGVQIWPLGFGGEIDRAALTAMAEGGYRGACSEVPGSAPRMRVVAGSGQIDKALQETFAAARCASIVDGTAGKPPADLFVTIPPIATDGSLTVAKHDPKVRVTYFDPRNRPVPTRGDFDGSAFEVSGADGPVEALRVRNPLPGRWRVHIEAPEGHRDREVAVRAIWQGRLRSAVVLDPVAPRAGQEAVVEVRMQTRRGVVITDPRQLQGVTVSARITGDGGFAPVTVRLADDGKAPDRTAGDVRFTGRLTVPATATGDLEIVADMAAPGVTSDRRPFHTTVTQGTPLLEAQVSVDRVTVHPGDTVHGWVDLTNHDSAPHTLRLALEDEPGGTGANSGPGSGLALAPATVVAQPGPATRAEFTLTVGKDAPLGALGGRLVVLDTGRGDSKLDAVFLDVRVEAPPTWWDRWWPYVVGGAIALVLLAAVAAVRIAVGRRTKDLTGVRIELLRDGVVLHTLVVHAGQSPGGEYEFGIDQPRGAAPTLRRGSRGGGAHRLRRTGAGELLFRPHRGRETSIRAGQPVAVDECELVVRDRRPAARGRIPAGRLLPGARRGGTGRPGRTGRTGRPGRTGGSAPAGDALPPTTGGPHGPGPDAPNAPTTTPAWDPDF